MRGSLAELAGSASADGRLPQAADLATPDPGSPSSVSVSVRSGIRSGRCRLLMSDRYDQDVTAANGEKTRQVGGPGPISGAWERAFAAFYDALLKSTEEAGNAARRNQVLARASGTVIELGAGTGFNLGHYPPDVELILCEPAEPMARRLEDRLTERGRSGDVVRAPAESLPVEDDVADTVVSTLVLCTSLSVQQQERGRKKHASTTPPLFPMVSWTTSATVSSLTRNLMMMRDSPSAMPLR